MQALPSAPQRSPLFILSWLAPTPANPTPPHPTHPHPARSYGWRWLQSYQEIEYKFTSLDKTTMSNVAAKSPRLWAHAVVTWVVSFFVYWWLWK